jgi:ion channel POLLUX/CASTOR
MTTEITWRDRLRYRFENTLSKGPAAMIAWLAVVCAVVVGLAGIGTSIFHLHSSDEPGSPEIGLVEGTWTSLMRTLDAGNLSNDGGWGLRFLMLIVTIFGIFVVSILIGTITSGLEAKLSEMRKGKSRVLESNHTLILGFSSKVFSIIGELIIANENQKNPSIVILAERDKVEMEDEIRAKFPKTKNTRVICRSGNPIDLDDLLLAMPNTARSIIVLAPEIESPDIYVIKTVLALTNHPERRSEPYHIVAEIEDEKNLEAATLVGGEEAIFVPSDDLIARVTAQTCRQSGLSVVYTELLDFDGAEIYFAPVPTLAGKSYREALMRFEESAVIGLVRQSGEVLINPAMETRFFDGDQVIAISEDDDTVVVGSNSAPTFEASLIQLKVSQGAQPERTLMLGWNRKGEAIIRELESYVAAGSEIVVVCESEEVRPQLLALSGTLTKQRLRFAKGILSTRSTLESLKPESFQHLIVLSDSSLPMQQADANTLITLLHLRKIADARGVKLNIVSEMQDIRNRALAQVARADDFIVSDKLVALMLSQLSENKKLDEVFKQLFSAAGSEICIRPASDYVKTGVAMRFYTVMEAAARKNETAIGYRRLHDANNKDLGFGVKVNPKKSLDVFFEDNDQIIVLAEA